MVARRGIARLIDDLLVMGVQYLSLLAGAIIYVLAGGDGGDPSTDAVIVAWSVGIAGFLACIVYEVTATRAGASLGKRACGLRIVDANGTRRLPLHRAMGRWLVVSGVQPLGWLALALGEGATSRDAVVLASLMVAAVAWRAGLAVSIVTDPGAQRGLHDHVVRSAVVRSSAGRSRWSTGHGEPVTSSSAE